MAEVRRLHVHCVSGLPSLRTPDEQARFRHSPERALVAARPGDVVCVPEPVDNAHLRFLNALGVGPAPDDVLTPEGTAGAGEDATLIARVRADRALLARIAAAVPARAVLELHPYATSADVLALAAALEAAGVARVRVSGGTPAASDRADHKHLVRARAVALGVPVAPGEVVELPFAGGRRRRDLDVLRAAIERQLRPTGRALLRGSVGLCGSSTFVVSERGGEHPEEVIHRIGARADNRVYLVEAMVDAAVSPNLHLHLDAGGCVTRVAASDQRWGRPLVHDGNLFPSGARLLVDMERWARTMAGWLHSEGYAGDVGLDFVEYRDPRTGAPAAFLAEVNPRVNGANYPLALREQLNAERRRRGLPAVQAFASGTLATRARSFGELADALEPLLFSHERGRGLVPYATGSLADARCPMVALAPTTREALELHAEAGGALEDACAAR